MSDENAETFRCAWCGLVFRKAITDEDAMAESTLIFGEAAMKEKLEVVCNDCWTQMMAKPERLM